ncbi:MAG: pirin family protein [Cyanobacteria bacterium P01_A01_bin.70]
MPIHHLLAPEVKDLGGFIARRSLPAPGLQMVGPFIFFDHLGPSELPAGKGIDVRPHPHINLATVTYLFDGAFMHRDSLGTVQEIRPGAVNWMTAGQGIVHSERSPERNREQAASIHGIQTWVALPADQEETAPWFHHYGANEIPTWQENGVSITLIAGRLGDRSSPVQALSPILYLDIVFEQAGAITLPAAYSEQAVYSIDEGLTVDGTALPARQLAILEPGQAATLAASSGRCMVIGGEPLGQRFKWWNFVSSRKDRIEQAKADWRANQFATVPHEDERIPLPERVNEANPL